jgi:SAM-dependent methyltransferase
MEINYKSILSSLSGTDDKIIKHLPYLLQDLWELGGGTDRTLDLLDRNLSSSLASSRILDLCCGNGPAIISIAKKHKCGGIGIDLFEPFIIEAREKSFQNNVQHLIKFQVMDIKEAVELFKNFDVVIYGGDTNVLGNEIESLKRIANCCKANGCIILELTMNSLEKIFESIREIGFKVVDKFVIKKEVIVEINKFNNEKINHRAQELIKRYPSQKKLIENYIRSQELESFQLENNLIWCILLLKRIA